MHAAAHAGTPFPLVILDGMMPEMDGFMVAEKIRGHTDLAGATVMMLSSAMPTGAAARCGELGVASYLLKPVSQPELWDAILRALGARSDTDSPSVGEVPSVIPLRIDEAKTGEIEGLRILIAEDNLINRAVISGILMKRGHVLTHASNGYEAVEAAAHGSFDVIIMDVQMPEMDGFEATRHIRESEIANHRHIPIVAMTAHAMAGDRERCLAAGMDHYLSKPLQQDALISLLELVSETSSNNPMNVAGITPAPALTPSDTKHNFRMEGDSPMPISTREELLDYFEDDEIMQKVIVLFHEQTPLLLEDIRVAVACRNDTDLARSSHSLLSSLGVFGANEAINLTRQLEAQGLEQNFENSDRSFALLKLEIDRIHAALQQMAIPPVDLVRLTGITGSDPARFRRIAADYLEQAEEILALISHAIERRDPAKIRRLAHKLGGSSSTCGVVAIAEPLARLELMSNGFFQAPLANDLQQQAFQNLQVVRLFLDEHLRESQSNSLS